MRNILLLFFIIIYSNLFGQQPNLDFAKNYINKELHQFNLLESDVQNIRISDAYYDKLLGVDHIYLQQQLNGIDIENAIFNLHLRDNKVLYSGNRFVNNINAKSSVAIASISANSAVSFCVSDLGVFTRNNLELVEKADYQEYIFDKADVAAQNIHAKLQYILIDEKLRLVWKVLIEPIGQSDHWKYYIDANTGEKIEKSSITIHCSFGVPNNDGCDNIPKNQFSEKLSVLLPPNGDGAKYEVFKFPLEAPTFGKRSIISDPADPIASPYGWHDTSGVAGAEFTITRGNNAHAYLDTDGNNKSDGNEPNGGSTLNFLFPYTDSAEPDSINKAAVINLFYVSNFMHDFTYNNGFDEVAGNFQQNNYGKGGKGNDYVLSEAQDNSKTASPSLNNANFSTLADGQQSRMQMFLWNSTSSKIFKINAPKGIDGYYESSPATWGKQIDNTPINLDLAIAYDNTNTLCCGDIVADVKGKLALVDRGTCTFGEKALNAEKAGAKAVCICNFEESLVQMAPGAVGNSVTIPVFMMKKSACDRIKEQLLAAKTVSGTLVLPPDLTGPKNLDGDFDNGIIAHEYGHGISNRLTGGPSNVGCLGNAEQMGEGWSDFFSLVTTAKAGQKGTDAKTVGTFALRQDTNGTGIRAYPYSTDMKINPNVYDDIIGAEIHRLGEIWTSCTWDLYWELVNLYGFDEDIIYGNGGNNKAIRLVIAGMKLQPCSPGFVDGRNAIIAADKLLYNGIHECLIWKVFARRGLGFYSSQGSSNSTVDGVSNFETKPACIKEIKVVKTATPLVDANQEITYTLQITNDKDQPVSNVQINDNIPSGTTYVSGFGTTPSNVTSNSISFKIDQLNTNESKAITYKLMTNSNKSLRTFFDDMEQGQDNWEFNSLNDSLGIFDFQQTEKKSGTTAWKVPNLATAQDQILQFFPNIKIPTNNPVMSFWHFYNTEAGFDGGFLQISTDGGTKWTDLGSKIFRKPYRGKINYSTFAIPNISAWWGNSNGWIQTYVDLSDYAGQTVNIRFRFGSNNGTGGNGWYIDDVELFEMLNYNAEVCVTTAEGDHVCTIVPEKGTIITPGVKTDSKFVVTDNSIEIYPNPSRDWINVAIPTINSSFIIIDIFDVNGQKLYSKPHSTNQNIIPIDISSYHSGCYIIKAKMNDKILLNKFVKN